MSFFPFHSSIQGVAEETQGDSLASFERSRIKVLARTRGVAVTVEAKDVLTLRFHFTICTISLLYINARKYRLAGSRNLLAN